MERGGTPRTITGISAPLVLKSYRGGSSKDISKSFLSRGGGGGGGGGGMPLTSLKMYSFVVPRVDGTATPPPPPHIPRHWKKEEDLIDNTKDFTHRKKL